MQQYPSLGRDNKMYERQKKRSKQFKFRLTLNLFQEKDSLLYVYACECVFACVLPQKGCVGDQTFNSSLFRIFQIQTTEHTIMSVINSTKLYN